MKVSKNQKLKISGINFKETDLKHHRKSPISFSADRDSTSRRYKYRLQVLLNNQYYIIRGKVEDVKSLLNKVGEDIQHLMHKHGVQDVKRYNLSYYSY